IAKKYGSVCTPDFFGYNSNLELQYRGRFDDRGMESSNNPNQSDLFKAMFLISRTGKGPTEQTPSIGCSIKWRE
ncbi:MAG: thioredoxin family protein, partial [Pseudomonadota bacterium]|nr:thioredoxin family protein [Pseudomonadota bacterium]